jgi:hypothetical protein
VLKALDYEDYHTYEFQVQVLDRGNPQLKSNLTRVCIVVVDYNDNRPIFLPSGDLFVSLQEGDYSRIYRTVGRVFATDADSGKRKDIRYTKIVPEGIMTVDSITGELNVNAKLDYEVQSQYKFVVIAQDQGTPFLQSTRTIILNVININDERPVFPQKEYNIVVSEATKPGSEVLVVVAEDPGNDKIASCIMKSSRFDDGDVFSINAAGSITLNSKLDYNKLKKHYNYTVECTDSGTPALTSTDNARVFISIGDVHSGQPVFKKSMYTHKMNENSFSNFKVSAESDEPTAS